MATASRPHGFSAGGLPERQFLRRRICGIVVRRGLIAQQAAGRRLIACLDELPDNQRGAFLLHHEDGFTVEAMAAALDLDADTVRTRLRFGLRKLRGCMERYLVVLGRRE